MNARQKLTLVACALVAGGALLARGPNEATAQTADPAAAAGHCAFNLKNQWAGPFKACQAPVTAEQCATIGKTDENSNAVWAAGACTTAGLVGSCKREKDTVAYYEGDASSLETGCGFQGGEWKAP
jgi:hypothetical protein